MTAANITNNKEGVPLSHYIARYRECDPEDIELRTGAVFSTGGVLLHTFGHTVLIPHPETVPQTDDIAFECNPPLSSLTGNPAKILFLRLLIGGQKRSFNRTFLSYRETPWGETYDRAFDGRVRRRLAGTFGYKIKAFEKAAMALGGVSAGIKDSSFDFCLPCGAFLRLILREGDDEFPPSSQVLFSNNIVSMWSAEDLAVLGEITIRALLECQNIYS